MSDQNAIQVAIDKKAVSKELLDSVVSQLLPTLESALSATIVNSISLQLTTLANSPTISKKDFLQSTVSAPQSSKSGSRMESSCLHQRLQLLSPSNAKTEKQVKCKLSLWNVMAMP